MAQNEELDTIDRKLLDIIQTAFPLVPRPYAELGRQLGISEEEALARVKGMKERKIIRRLGANFQSAKLGFRSTLCGAHVPEEKLDAFIADVNALPGVTAAVDLAGSSAVVTGDVSDEALKKAVADAGYTVTDIH